MIGKRKIATKIALGLIGTPYLYGGKNLMVGVDCSGFVQGILGEQAIKIMKPEPPKCAHDQLIHFSDRRVDYPSEGYLVFYGRPEKINHVMFCLDGYWCIGAAGGNSRIDCIPKAYRQKAMVRILPIGYRRDIAAYVDPFMLKIGEG